MTIVINYSGAGASGQQSANPLFTNTADVGDLLVCFASIGNANNALPEILEDGWGLAAAAAGGAGVYAIDNGPRISAIFVKIADGTEVSGSGITVLNPGSGPVNQLATYAYITRLTKTFSDWSVQATSGTDDTDGNTSLITGADNIGVTAVGALDMLWVASAFRPDTSIESSPVLTVPGCTMNTLTLRRSTATLQGNDLRHLTYSATVATGTQSAPASWALNWSTSDVSGAATFLRVREVDVPTGIVNVPVATGSAQGLAPKLLLGIEASGDTIAEAIAEAIPPQITEQLPPPPPPPPPPVITAPAFSLSDRSPTGRIESLLQSLADRIRFLESINAEREAYNLNVWTLRENDAGQLVATTEAGQEVVIATPTGVELPEVDEGSGLVTGDTEPS